MIGDRMGSLTGVPVTPLVAAVERDEEELAKKLLLVAAIRVTVVTLALGVLFALVQLNPPGGSADIQNWQYILIAITYGLSIVYAAALRYRKLILPLAYAQIGLDSLIVSVLVLMTGGVESIFGFAYVFPVLGGAVALYRRGGLVAAVVTVMMYGAIVSAQLTKLMAVLPMVYVPANALLSYALHSAGMALVAVLSSTLAEKAKQTGRALAEKQFDFEQLQELHAAILRSLPAGLLTVDSDARIRYANDAAINILRTPVGDLLGQPLQVVVPEMRVTFERWLSDPAIGRDRHESAYERGDGTKARLGYSFAPLNLSVGGSSGSIVVFQDVTDIVRLKEVVERSRRLATVGKFAAGLAHEVRNPLASMCASIDVLSASLDPPDSMQKLMSNVVDEATRLNRLITDFLALARPRALQLEKKNLSDVVRNVLDVFENDGCLKAADLVADLETEVEAVFDEDLIRQVLWNMLRNAAEALDGSGTLSVITKDERGLPLLTVRDDGPGMAPEQLKRVFDPFYTTKERGSGLGLAISHSIVEAHAGHLTVESAPGKGTSVTIRFRAVRDSAEIDTSDLVNDAADVELISTV